MFLTENLHFEKSASIAFDRSNASGLSPNPYNKQKERTIGSKADALSFSVRFSLEL